MAEPEQIDVDSLSRLYYERGRFQKIRKNWKAANTDFDKALEIKPDHLQAVFHKSQVESELVNTAGAHDLSDKIKAHKSKGDQVPHSTNNLYVDTLYSKNKFETSLAHVSNALDVTESLKDKRDCIITQRILDFNFENAVGLNAGPCLLDKRNIIEKIAEHGSKAENDTRPLWKQLKEQNECDTQSIREVVVKSVSKLRSYYLEKNQDYLNQVYLGTKTAKDVLFLKNLSTNTKTFQLSQLQASYQILKDLTFATHTKGTECRKMLHNRQPLYSKRFLNPALLNLQHQNLLIEQYKTRREAFTLLEKAQELLEANDLPNLLKHVENAMANYFPIKTKAVFPRKCEFIHDMYFTVGVAYIKCLRVPPFLKLEPIENQLHLLLGIPYDEKLGPMIPIFGDKSTFKDPTAPDYDTLRLKNKCDYFEKRCQFAEYPIEKCYLYHERAILNLQMKNPEEGRILGRKIVDEESGENQVWKFLGALMEIKANTMQFNVEKNSKDMQAISSIAEKLDESCHHFVQLMQHLNSEVIKQKQQLSAEQQAAADK